MVVGGMELNSLNCIVLSLVLAATLLTYLLMGCLVITMGAAIKPDSGYYKHYTPRTVVTLGSQSFLGH